MSSPLVSDSIFWVDVEKIKPNPYQPRREFDPMALESLADSIRQYGVLQPLVVTRREIHKDDGGIVTEYELIAGERRLRASKIANLAQVPVVIRTGEDNNLMKLELAIIENLQREDLNPIDRAKAFQQFVDEFGYKHLEIAKKVGKSREYVSNSLRLLSLPDDIIDALISGKITEGHARPLMMLKERPDEQNTLFKEIMFKKLTVRDAESIARRIAQDKVRKRTRDYDPEILQMEKELTEQLGTRVHIEPREVGGKITIDFFSDDDLKNLLAFMNTSESRQTKNTLAEEAPKFSQEPNQSVSAQEQKTEEVVREVVPETSVVATAQEEATAHEPHEIKTIVEPQFQSEAVGTVAFGGAPHILDEQKQTSLGDVLRNVLAKDNVPSTQTVREEIPVPVPQPPHPAEVTTDVTPIQHEDTVSSDSDIVPPHEAIEAMELPDTGIFRNEVDTILGSGDGISSKDEHDPLSRMLDEIHTDQKTDTPGDDMYSIKNFAV